MILAHCKPDFSTVHAGVKEDLEQFFISRGQSVNVTEGGAYHDQTGSYFTGGSLMTRAKADKYGFNEHSNAEL
jgi:hypothetical protein